MNEILEKYLPDEQATVAAGYDIAKACPPHCIIYLIGELGAGKTTFARGFLRAFGFEKAVKSPTYTLVECYHLPQQNVFHFDLYRLTQPEELEFIGARDYFRGPAICLIEWPEKALEMLPTADLSCYIQQHDSGRKLLIKANTAVGTTLLEKLNK